MTAILGISAFYHDSAAALVVDGEIVAAAQEERFTRKKHDPGFPRQAVAYCLAQAGLTADQLDYVAYYEKPLVKFERLLESFLAYAPSGYWAFRVALPVWLNQKLFLPREIRRSLGRDLRAKLVFTDHHEAHAASAFFASPFAEAAILTLDGVGEWSTTCLGHGRDNRLTLECDIRFPHSLGLLYSAFTYYTGFRVNSGEYKVMGLAPYGRPIYRDVIFDKLLDLKADGSFRLDMRYFNYARGLTMTSRDFHDLFGGPPRSPESKLTQKDMDLAASLQAVTEEVMLACAREAHRRSGSSNLVLAGGVALNCVGNGKILREGPFEHLWIQPAAGDAGGALGAALFTWFQLLEKPRPAQPLDRMHGALLGPAFSDDAIDSELTKAGLVFHTVGDDDALANTVAEHLAAEKVVGWFQGRMEFGPRALGNRSILGDARSPAMQSTMNLKIKFRESFRPFAPIVLRDYVHDYFAMRPNEDSPYMLLVAEVLEKHRLTLSADQEQLWGIEKLNVPRSVIPAITHVDYSARIQTVDSDRHPVLEKLLRAFHERTGYPVLINTSFNVRGEPIVCTPADAIRCFLATDIDVLVLGRHVVLKAEQKAVNSINRSAHLAQFHLD